MEKRKKKQVKKDKVKVWVNERMEQTRGEKEENKKAVNKQREKEWKK